MPMVVRPLMLQRQEGCSVSALSGSSQLRMLYVNLKFY